MGLIKAYFCIFDLVDYELIIIDIIAFALYLWICLFALYMN